MVVLAFDYGTRRLGIATGNTETRNISPLKIVPSHDWPAITRVVQQWQPAFCLMGLALNMDGSMSPMAVKAQKFALELAQQIQQKILFADERLSSNSVRFDLDAAGLSSKQAIDDLAAARILASWFANIKMRPSQ